MKKFLLVLICFLIISPCAILFSGCGTPQVYAIEVQSSDAEYGSVSGNGSFTENTNVTLRATALKEANFICWTHNNKVVSIDSEYTFQATNSTQGTYVALFDQRLDYYALTDVNLTLNDGAQVQEFYVNLQIGASLSSLNNIYDITTNPLVRNQNYTTVAGFYNGLLLHKKTTDTNFYCKMTAKATYGEDVRNYADNCEINFNELYDTNESSITKQLSGYGTITFTFKKITTEIAKNILGINDKK